MNTIIEHAEDETVIPTIRSMFQEYSDSLGLNLDSQNFTEELATLPGRYVPPSGCLLLARADGEPAGCVALRPLGYGISEMKRLYVRPAYRGLKLGRALAERIIQEARDRGYNRIRLDTIASRMSDAVALYQAIGFRPIPPYSDCPFPDALFLELSLK